MHQRDVPLWFPGSNSLSDCKNTCFRFNDVLLLRLFRLKKYFAIHGNTNSTYFAQPYEVSFQNVEDGEAVNNFQFNIANIRLVPCNVPNSTKE